MHKLEVIVMTAAEARIAEESGADRLELVRDLDSGGLTPDIAMVRAVLAAVSIPVRVMLRENGSMAVANTGELDILQTKALQMRELPLDGLVMGWTTAAGAVDIAAMARVLTATGKHNITFHRAFEHLADPLDGLRVLKQFSQIDKILTNGGAGSWTERKQRLGDWSQAAAPEIGILVGGGLSEIEIAELMSDPNFPEVHVGRAARSPQENSGALDAAKIALLKKTA